MNSLLLSLFLALLPGASDQVVKVEPGMWHVYKLTRQEAEQNMHYLAVVSDKEDSWTHDGEALVDTGYSEAESTVGYDVAEVAKYFTETPPPSGNLDDYHIHPLQDRKNGDISTPSIADIRTHAKLKKCMAEQGVTTHSYMLDGCGIWEYDVADEIIDLLSDDSEGTKDAKEYVEDMLNQSRAQINDAPLPLEVKAQTYADRVRDLGVIVSYKSME